ncbi:FAD-binding protein, partial [Dysosmobacter sp.]|uniref:FAD-binding protein n=2 Tax=Dysosmobacter sp. TaxID=2591382 RepID=UPI003AB50446
MNKISRKGFLKIAAAAAMGTVTAGALTGCNSASSSVAASGSASASGGLYTPGTYEGTAEGISSTVKVTMTFSETAVTDVVVDTSGETASYGAAAADQLKEQLLAAGSAEIDGVSGSTITSEAVMKAAKSCFAQAMGETVVTSVQLPTGDENNWLGTEPDIDEDAITETWDTDIVIVGAGNGGMCAAAFAAQNGLNFRIIEQNSAVMETRHWYGTIDSSEAKKQGVPPVDRAELLSEISRSMGGRCDQRVVKTWINESAAMHDFVSGILESAPYNYTCNLTLGDEAKWPDDTQISQTKLMFPVQQVDYSSAEKPRNQVFQEYIESLGYSIDFNTGLAKLEKSSDGRITGVIAQSTDDGHFIRINAAKGVLLACGGYAGNPYMMEQLDPLGTSVTTACSYAPADKGYGIRAAIWAGAHLDAEAAPVLFDRGLVAPGVNSGYVESPSSFGGKAFPGTVGQYNPGSQPFLKVNRHGERFMNESQEYDNASHASFQQPGHVYAMIHDANFREDVDRFHTIGCSALTRYIPGMMESQLEEFEAQGLIMKADTIEELADKMGFTGADKDTFVATVARYNELYDMQKDEDFGKPASRLSAIKTAPFYGC